MATKEDISIRREVSFRRMMLDLMMELPTEEYETLAYLVMGNLPTSTCTCLQTKRLHVISSLESSGYVGPLKLEYLEEALARLKIPERTRSRLLEIITNYKKTPLYKDAKKKQEKKKGGKSKTPYSANTQELLIYKDATESESMKMLGEIYEKFLTEVSRKTYLMRSSLETRDSKRIKETFTQVANEESVTHILRKNLSAAGINSGSSSSGESSSKTIMYIRIITA